ncbi:hypothetical protein TL16_g00485 [Triparma laevis f. inornata]|uniref:Uncharacterized protein n=2 Tax=Triparma laevis TaxID=1534972 RepID=A0A9W6ZGC8_9STRA|nr:hypothetical protein TL16_g00485 [Triparma laevis f. inornata]GMH49860.1 hypothetical protein TrLO_g5029 [Triparma laevis f. longispina]
MFSRVTSTLLRRSSALRTLSTPTVSSKTVSLTFIDSMGSRLTVPALHGQNLYEVATNNKIDLGPNPSVGGVVEKAHSERWTEDLFGVGSNTGFDHVIIPSPYHPFLPPRSEDELSNLQAVWDEEEIGAGSRLASSIVVNGEMNGMTVFVPDGVPDDCP